MMRSLPDPPIPIPAVSTSDEGEYFSISKLQALLLCTVLGVLLVGAPLAVTLMPLDPADELPAWALALVWAAMIPPAWLLWRRFGGRLWKDAIVVSAEGFHPRNECTVPIPWSKIEGMQFLEQIVVSGTGRHAVPVHDRSLLVLGAELSPFRSRRGPSEPGALRRRGLEEDPNRLLVIVTEVVPRRGDPPGAYQLLSSIARFHSVERLERREHGGEWRSIETIGPRVQNEMRAGAPR